MSTQVKSAAKPRRTIAEIDKQLAKALAERDEARAQQAATAEILRVIAGSPTDLQPTFEAIASRAKALFGAVSAGVFPYDGALIHVGAHRDHGGGN
ncbi:MAG: hypothetical protein ACREFD_00645 [Stellaceae bacterium]